MWLKRPIGGCKVAARLGRFIFGFKRLRRDLTVRLLQQNFHAAFGFFKLFLAFARKLHALFEKFHGLVERQVGALEALDDFLEGGRGTSRSRLCAAARELYLWRKSFDSIFQTSAHSHAQRASILAHV